jgi:hypothetical protein
VPISGKPLTSDADGAILTTGHMTGFVSQGGIDGVDVLPNMENMRIPVEKFVNYSLDPLKQPDKARAFRLALGYDKSNYQSLMDEIATGLPYYEATPKGDIGFGMRYEVVMQIKGANGKTASVLTAWIDDKSTGEMRMTNAYVDKPKGGARK